MELGKPQTAVPTTYLFSYTYIFAAVPCRAPLSGQVADNSINLEVLLPSGRRETVSVLESGTIADLKIAAQQSLKKGFLRLAASDGRLLNPFNSSSPCRALPRRQAAIAQPKIAATRHAFALCCVGDHKVVTWGDPHRGAAQERSADL